MTTYLAIGLGFYLGISLCRLDSFKDATLVSIVRGFVLGLLFWPIGAVVLVLLDHKNSETTQRSKKRK